MWPGLDRLVLGRNRQFVDPSLRFLTQWFTIMSKTFCNRFGIQVDPRFGLRIALSFVWLNFAWLHVVNRGVWGCNPSPGFSWYWSV